MFEKNWFLKLTLKQHRVKRGLHTALKLPLAHPCFRLYGFSILSWSIRLYFKPWGSHSGCLRKNCSFIVHITLFLIHYRAYSEHRVGSAAFQHEFSHSYCISKFSPGPLMLFFFFNPHQICTCCLVESLTFLFQSINLSPYSQRSNPTSSAPWWFICLILCLVVHVYFFLLWISRDDLYFLSMPWIGSVLADQDTDFWIMVNSFKNGYPNLPALCLQRKESKAGLGQSFVP